MASACDRGRRGGWHGRYDTLFSGGATMNGSQLRRILVGWDCSPGAAAALLAAAEIADGAERQVVALAILRPVSRGESEEEQEAEMAARRHQAEESFRIARDALPDAARAGVTLDFTESPDPARTLCEYADAHVFGLIALGRHGTGGMLHRRLGHVAEAVAKKTNLPVLLLGNQS
jgi:nucleotide-binding universal stress UspA family protein